MGCEWAARCTHVGFGTVLKKRPDPEREEGFALEPGYSIRRWYFEGE